MKIQLYYNKSQAIKENIYTITFGHFEIFFSNFHHYRVVVPLRLTITIGTQKYHKSPFIYKNTEKLKVRRVKQTKTVYKKEFIS